MNRALLLKNIRESYLLLAACALAIYLFCWVRVWLVSQFDMQRFQIVVEQFREYERFSPVPFDQLFTYAGRIALTYNEPIVVLCLSVWAIARGSAAVSGEIGRGTMEMLLAQPLSRQQILWTQAFITIAGIAVLAAASWLGIYTGIHTTTVEQPPPAATITVPFLQLEIPNPFVSREPIRVPMSEKVDGRLFVPAACNLFALGVFLAGFSTLMSAWDRYRWRTIGIVVGTYVVQMAMKIVGLASDRFAWLQYGSFFTAYEPEVLVGIAANRPEQTWAFVQMQQGDFIALGPLGYIGVLVGLGVIGYLAAALVFSHRDLPAPL